MPRIRGIVIIPGGGINLGSPAVLEHYLKLQSITPPLANTGVAYEDFSAALYQVAVLGSAGADSFASSPRAIAHDQSGIALGVDSDVTGIDALGIGSRVAVAGAAATALGADAKVFNDSLAAGQFSVAGKVDAGASAFNTALGNFAEAGNEPTAAFGRTDNTAVGYAAIARTGGNTALGAFATAGGATGTDENAVALGDNSNAPFEGSIALGQAAETGADYQIVAGAQANPSGLIIGQSILIGPFITRDTIAAVSDAILIGYGHRPQNSTGTIALGNNPTLGGKARLVSGDMVLGHQDDTNAVFTTQVYLGGGPQHTSGVAVPALTWRGRRALGNNIGAGDLTVLGQLATGAGADGGLALSTGDNVNPGAAVQHASAVGLRLDPAKNITLCAAAGSYGTGLGVVFLGNAATIPSTNPAAGVVLYVDPADGILKVRGSAGTVTALAIP
jgi:hypothetical protein